MAEYYCELCDVCGDKCDLMAVYDPHGRAVAQLCPECYNVSLRSGLLGNVLRSVAMPYEPAKEPVTVSDQGSEEV